MNTFTKNNIWLVDHDITVGLVLCSFFPIHHILQILPVSLYRNNPSSDWITSVSLQNLDIHSRTSDLTKFHQRIGLDIIPFLKKLVERLLLFWAFLIGKLEHTSLSLFPKALYCSTPSAAGLQSVYGLSRIDFVLYGFSFLCLFHFCSWTDSQNDLRWPSSTRVVSNTTTYL